MWMDGEFVRITCHSGKTYTMELQQNYGVTVILSNSPCIQTYTMFNDVYHCVLHTQLDVEDKEKSWNLNETSPAAPLSSCVGWELLLILISPEIDPSSHDNGCIWFSFGWCANWTSRGNGNTEGDKGLGFVLSTLEVVIALSQRKTCRRIGTLVCRCKESFWLNETVS
jgi:hypothetical protein